MSRDFVCRCEDVDMAELMEAIEEGFSDLESLRRFTAVGTGPCQGKACIAETVRILARHHGVGEDEIGQMTIRPPFSPVPLGLLAAFEGDALERLMDGDAAVAARRTREALEDDRAVRTGRPTPDSVRRSLALHRLDLEGDGSTTKDRRTGTGADEGDVELEEEAGKDDGGGS